jgi:hypothetical protein
MKNIFAFGILSAIIFGCSNHDTNPAVVGETPASALVASKQVSVYKYNGSYNGAALGYEFKVKADGHITGLGCAVPSIGNYVVTLFKVDTINKSGTQIAKLPILVSASDTTNYRFKYDFLPSKVAISKGNYYRVAVNGDFTAYDYLSFPTGSPFSLPLPLPTNTKFIFTKGVAGYANQYPDTEYTTYLFPADVVVQFP